MEKDDTCFYEIVFLGRSCSSIEIPFEYTEFVDISDIIRLSDSNLDEVINRIKNDNKLRKGEKVSSSFGHIIDYYYAPKRLTIGLTDSLPAIQLRCPSIEGLERKTEELGLPIVYSAIHRP